MDDQDTFLDIPFDDSSIFSYISNLSPIKPFKGAPVAQGFPGLNSPLHVFKSPQIDPPSQSSLLKRPQYPGLSSDELRRQDDDKGNAQLSSELNACSNNKGHGNNGGPAHDKSGIDFEGVDDYFLDFMEVGCDDSGNLTNFGLKQCDDAPPSLKESIEPKKNDMTKSLSNLKPLGTDVKNGGRVMPISSSAHHTYEGQQNELLEVENAGGVHQVELNYTSQLLQESREPVHEYDDCSETTGGFSIEQSMMLHDSKVTQQQYGMRRHCLQFEETRQNIMANSPGPRNQIKAARNSRSHANCAIPVYPEVLESSCADIPAPPSTRLLEKMKKPTFSMFPAQNFGHPNLKVSKPSGTGLNLNCLGNKMSMGSGGSASGSTKSYGMPMGIGITGCQLTENARNSSISSNVAQTLSVRSEENKHKNHANPMLSKKPTEHPATPFDKMKSISDHADSVEELNRSGPRKKRKKTSGSNDGNGCKNCNCKKTKCLKLYCDCFASGNYCDEHCSCRDCYNRPEFEETVIETRKQIESRNPFAFAPKIVSDVLELPAKTNQVLNAADQIMMDPNNSLQKDIKNSIHSSARHKQGCNCKKSMCLKKYCECYQSNVGCSDGCRCEGCKNVYGKKEEYSTKDNVIVEGTNESSEISLNKKLGLMAARNGFLQNELCNSHNSTPLTPSFLLSDHGKGAMKSRFPSGMYTPSPKSDLTFSAPHGNPPGYPRSSDNPNMIQDTSKEIMGVVSFGEELYYANSARVDAGFRDMNNITILQNPPSMSMAPLRNLSSAQLCPGNGGPFPSASSLQWHSSPITQFIDSDKGLYDLMEHDDTPDILKENPTPNIGVKVSSPNKKRVSPPHSRFREFGSSSSVSSVGARSRMKLILDGGPSFPPVAPRIDPNGTTIQGANDHLDRSNS